MSIVILYESEEWSNQYLRDALIRRGLKVLFINPEEAPFPDNIPETTRLIINRLYPSAFFRGHNDSYFHGPEQLRQLSEQGFPMLNPYPAMTYDFSKALTGQKLTEHHIPVPQIYTVSSDFHPERIRYPCIIKPDCGGRAAFTSVHQEEASLLSIMKTLPPIKFLFQEYIAPAVPYTVRIEVIDGEVFSAVRRSVDENGLSGLHLGSDYEVLEELEPEYEELVLKAFEVLEVKMGGADVVIGKNGPVIIDVNATSNFSPQVIEVIGKNPLDKMADFIAEHYRRLPKSKSI